MNKCRRFSRSTQLGGIKQKLRNVRSQDRLNMQVGDADKEAHRLALEQARCFIDLVLRRGLAQLFAEIQCLC